MLRTPIRTALVSLVAGLTLVTTAAAITGSTPDGEAHPYVGALVVDGSVACSGVLIAPTVFATAGHCGADGTRVEVSLNSKLDGSWTLVRGTLEVDTSRRSDLAVVLLDAAVGTAPATLPKADSVALLKRKDVVTSVGYGYSSQAADGSWVYDGIRRVADSPVVDVTKKMLKISTRQGWAVYGRFRRASARRQHRSLCDVRRSEGLHRPRRGLSRRHGVRAHLPRASTSPSRCRPGAAPRIQLSGRRLQRRTS